MFLSKLQKINSILNFMSSNFILFSLFYDSSEFASAKFLLRDLYKMLAYYK